MSASGWGQFAEGASRSRVDAVVPLDGRGPVDDASVSPDVFVLRCVDADQDHAYVDTPECRAERPVGPWDCRDDDQEVGPGVPETRDGLDNDCDGQTDVAPVDGGGVCSLGVGACRRDGVKACIAGRLACDVIVGSPEAERCNRVDDNCDGQVDEGFGTRDCGTGVCLHPGGHVDDQIRFQRLTPAAAPIGSPEIIAKGATTSAARWSGPARGSGRSPP